MTLILDSLKKSLDKIALLVQLGIEVMFYFEINFIGNANGCAVSDEVQE